MWKGKKVNAVCLICTTMLFALIGCNGTENKNALKDETSPSPVISMTQEARPSVENTVGSVNQGSEKEQDKGKDKEGTVENKEKTKEISVYCINDDVSDKDSVTVCVPQDEKITAELITNLVVSEFVNQNLTLGVKDVTEENGIVTVNFTGDDAPVVNVGAGIEVIILDCISQSILDNISSCDKIIFHIDGEAYESGHQCFGFDEPYLWR